VPGFRSEVMVGRENELAILRELASTALAGRPETILLLGEAGIGKTRLALELVEDLGTTTTLCPISRGVDLAGDELSFGATSQLLRSLVRTLGPDPVRRAAGPDLRVLAALHPQLAREAAAGIDPPAVLGAVQTLLEALDRPACWVLDDLQWMDVASQDLVGYLSRVLTDVPVLLLATVRTTPPALDMLPPRLVELGRTSTVLQVGPLGRADVAAQASALADDGLTARDLTRIAELSDGVPFFVEQLVASRTADPRSAHRVVLPELEGLSPDARGLLASAAVGEGLLRPALLRRVAGGDVGDVDGALAELRVRGVLQPAPDGEVLEFRHALLREAVEAGLLAEDRRELHHRWAAALDDVVARTPGDRAAVVERARHHYASGDPHALAAVRDAAWAAEHVDDDHVRVRWWGRALALSPLRGTLDLDRDLALSRYVAALWATGEVPTIESVLADELEGETDRLRALWLRLAHWRTLRAMQLTFAPALPVTDAEETVSFLSTCRSRDRQRDFRLQEVRRHLADDWRVERPDLARGLLADLLADLDPDTDRDVAVDAYWTLGLLEAVTGDEDAMPRRMQESLTWLRTHGASGQLAAQGMVAVALLNAGHLEAARDLAEETVRLIREPQLRPQLWVVEHLTLARTALTQGDWAAVDRFLHAADQPNRGGDLATWWHTLACTLAARRGRPELARQELETLLIVAPVDRDDIGDLERVSRAVAELEVAVAEQDLVAAVRAATSISSWTSPGELATDVWEAWVGCLRASPETPGSALPPEAAVVLDRDLRTRNREGGIAQACASELEARLSTTSAAAVVAEAAARWLALGRPYDAGWCRLLEAEAAARDGDRHRAAAALTEVLTTADRLGAGPLRERAEAAARRWRIDGVGRAVPATGLTTRETEVLALLAEGRTNAQIAEQLFMSPKTASVHVSHVIAKLGVANRTEAAALAHRRGLVAGP